MTTLSYECQKKIKQPHPPCDGIVSSMGRSICHCWCHDADQPVLYNTGNQCITCGAPILPHMMYCRLDNPKTFWDLA